MHGKNNNEIYSVVWRNDVEEVIEENDYNILEDECDGFRCLKKSTQLDPACYNEEQCNENCDSSKDEFCLDIDEWKNTCSERTRVKRGI